MTAPHPQNERVKRRYLHRLREADGLADVTIDNAASTIWDFEQFIGGRDFKTFSEKDALGYKRLLLKRDGIRGVFLSYVEHLGMNLMWGRDDPLFPRSDQQPGPDLKFHVAGLRREHWITADPIRSVFRKSFAAAGVPYFSPHTIRRTLTILGLQLCKGDGELLKVWSQNAGHDDVLTTLSSYGARPFERQLDLLRGLAEAEEQPDPPRTSGGTSLPYRPRRLR